ncbi:hypothetical protein [Marininema mesophilum]|uniref:hypothetical protein n=1 Tax=Marininema mesophilum TaxID=1048340 RepID=UPI0015A50DC2|nr:hypothetical protein [Marininema mesophilum]
MPYSQWVPLSVRSTLLTDPVIAFMSHLILVFIIMQASVKECQGALTRFSPK